ncbi:MAG: pilus assembly protein N-terminal domain-containing protein [Myxococcales bacterium]
MNRALALPRLGLRMCLRAAVALALVTAHIEVARADEQRRELQLGVGEQHVIPGESIASYSEGIEGIVDVRLTPDGARFVLVGKREGITSLLLMHEGGDRTQYRITVGSPASPEPADAVGPVEARDNIRLDFYFVQLTRDGNQRTGIEWPASYGGGTLGASVDLLSGSFTRATAMVTDQALPRLDLAQSEGWAKLMRQAAVITQNGSEANFSGGGEVNIPVQSALAVGVRQIEYGSRVKVRPRYDRDSGRLELTIHAEVSDLASDHGSGIPGRVTSDLVSVVNLELGQSLVLAGLTASSEAASRRGLPGLSQIPLVGMLFGTHESRAQQTRNLIFIVPSVVDAVSMDARDRLRGAIEAFRAYDGDLDDLPLDPPMEAER